MKRLLPLMSLAFLLLGCSQNGRHYSSPLRICYVEIQPMNKGQFQKISEFFTNEESQSGRIILRSDPSIREGLYFIVKLNRHYANLPQGSVLVVEYTKKGVVKPIITKFPLYAKTQSLHYVEAYLGLTSQSVLRKTDISSWKVSIHGSDSKNLVEPVRSFLWTDR